MSESGQFDLSYVVLWRKSLQLLATLLKVKRRLKINIDGETLIAERGVQFKQ